VTRDNVEDDLQFTQELRVASAAPVAAAGMSVRWQAGVFFFDQNYTQNAVNHYAPYVLSPLVPLPVDQQTPTSALMTTAWASSARRRSFQPRVEAGLGVRVDHGRSTPTC
jgi:hypothetical protein